MARFRTSRGGRGGLGRGLGGVAQPTISALQSLAPNTQPLPPNAQPVGLGSGAFRAGANQPLVTNTPMSLPAQPLPAQQGLPQQALPVQPNVPQTGLIGAEQGLQGGLAAALAGLTEGIGQARAGINTGAAGGLRELSQARTQGLGAINQSIGQGVSGLEQFTGAGLQGQQLQAALAGLQGQDAFNQALTSNPATQFLQQQGEQAALRTAGARGGLGGGNVMKELSRFNTGLASQDLQNQFNRAGALTGQGLQAAGGIGQLRGQQAGLASGLVGNLGQAGANIQTQAGQQLGNLGFQGGLFAAQSALGTGRDLAAGRTRAGEQIAGQIGGTTSALSNLVNQQGGGVSDITGQAGGNLANLLSGAGQAQAGSQQQLATLLANLSTQQGSTVADLPGIPGSQQQSGILGGLGALAGGVGTAVGAFSDIRLKDNIKKVGVSNGGHNLYTWDWNEKGAKLAGDQPTFGVIAQEVMATSPDIVNENASGYLTVDYKGIH